MEIKKTDPKPRTKPAEVRVDELMDACPAEDSVARLRAWCDAGITAYSDGMAVPGTGMLVMAMAPPEQAGSVSAMMNALRQAGMTIGIALLGTLMSVQAIRTLTASLDVSGIGDAAQIAHLAVTRHLPTSVVADFSARYTAAMESGFHLAMLCAGGTCFVAVALLLRLQWVKEAQGINAA